MRMVTIHNNNNNNNNNNKRLKLAKKNYALTSRTTEKNRTLRKLYQLL